jgi:hypothetical protein
MVTDAGVERVLDKLQRVYPFRLDLGLLPHVFRERFYQAAHKFADDEIDETRMGLVEETGDLIYQVMKLDAVKRKILTPRKQKALYDKFRDKIDPPYVHVFLDELYAEAREIANPRDSRILSGSIPYNGNGVHTDTAREFLANQYVSYISRALKHIPEIPHH